MIELLMALVVMAVLLAIGVPSFRTSIAGNRLSSSTNELVSALALARSEAVRRGNRITVCKSADGANCTTAGGWQQGWIVFTDGTRATAVATVDVGETVISRGQAVSAPVMITGNAGAQNFVSFAADGTVRTMAGALQAGVLRVCYPNSALGNERRARDIELLATGRLTLTTPGNVAVACPAP
ncbi:GspH/FimT family pseudopilin [Hydrogenophaga crocea]|uniref:Type II secretion system protein H n=1 Tax=Hydrogenophaga crocea TaxID=2716225 RepID=A0A6G8IEC2_9BURK|nr:GspH/FimT family pseudopilin [Hydrogenophaga crocea]QIM51340.1 type IV fimbrial biogenesis protein FimT [Hydrogenophaga crocea]